MVSAAYIGFSIYMDIFKGCKWIWQNNNAQADEHAEFIARFFCTQADIVKGVKLYISADSDFGVYLNGTLVDFGQYPDYPHFKTYEEIDLTPYAKAGENILALQVWYYGENSSTYLKGEAGVLFAVQGEKQLCASGTEVLSRISKAYQSHQKKIITGQMGFSYAYDAEKEDGWQMGSGEGFASAMVLERAIPKLARPVARIKTEAPILGKVIKKEKNRYLLDFGAETVGIFQLHFFTKFAQNIRICYGEHILDGWVRDKIAQRDFSVEYHAKAGQNDYLGYFRRLGLRYAEIRTEEEIEGLEMQILPRVYPLHIVEYTCADKNLRNIYEVCRKTLTLCMHDHYEDCPWREQAMYAMDSRNQMLCGYYAFQEYAFPRACLRLMAEGIREDGLLPICFPAGIDLTIPSFSLHYFTAVREYGDYSGDWTLAKEILPVLERILNTYLSRRNADGLTTTFEGKEHWNFYEWADGLSSDVGEKVVSRPDLIINCLLSLALQHMAYICGKLGLITEYAAQAERLNAAIHTAFYDETQKGYTMYALNGGCSELGNALAVLCGVAGMHAKEICDILVTDNHWTKITLSMKCFKYDALLKTADGYQGYILADIQKIYGNMLATGATSVWETELGAEDFDGAGSLCHGWSALPVYYLWKFGQVKKA